MLRAILDNPIAVREWRVLRRRALDWRIWVGVRWPLDPMVWGAPVVLTYALAPYALWLVLLLLRRLHLLPGGRLPLDALFVLALVFWCYVVSVSLVLGATAVTREREQRTWDQILITPLTGRQRAAGLLWGRLGPVWASLLLTFSIWWLLYPHFAALLTSVMGSGPSRGLLLAGTLTTLALSAFAGEIGLLASARAARSTTAAVTGAIGFVLVVCLLSMIGPVPFVGYLSGYVRAGAGYLASLGTILAVWITIYLSIGLWAALEAEVERR
jgi:hypothetical protein